MPTNNFEERLKNHAKNFAPVVPIHPQDKILLMDFTSANTELSDEIINDTNAFIQYINTKLKLANARYGVGGYDELRTIYRRSGLFGPSLTTSTSFNDGAKALGGGQGARCLHLGLDIWGKPYTKVMAPLDGIAHSFAFNNAYGDYGATIILTHQLDGEIFHTLYGHLSLNSLKNLCEGDLVKKGDVIAEFGIPFENGQWPPHLHFQLIKDMQGMKGDYPGVCTLTEREKYLKNCPDPALVFEISNF